MSIEEEFEKRVTEEVEKRLQEEADRKLQEEAAQKKIEEEVEKRLQGGAESKLLEEATQKEIEKEVEKRLQKEPLGEALKKFQAEPKDDESKLLRYLRYGCAIVASVLCVLACFGALSPIWAATLWLNGNTLIFVFFIIALLILSLFFLHISKAISIAAEERSLEYRKLMYFLVLSEMVTDSAKKDELYQMAALSLFDSNDAL